MEPQWEFDLLTDDGKVLRWPGTDAEDAARRCADAKQVTIVATRPVRHGLFTLGGGTIVG